jgi:hypothetical protein
VLLLVFVENAVFLVVLFVNPVLLLVFVPLAVFVFTAAKPVFLLVFVD